MRLRNEEGSVLVVALAILALLTIIGVVATNTARVELLCASADVQHKKAFYCAEGGANLALAAARDRVKALKGSGTTKWSTWTTPDTFTNLDYSIPNSTMQFSVSIVPKRNPGGHIVFWGDTNNNGTLEENTTGVGYPVIIINSTGFAPGNAVDVVEVIAKLDTLFEKIPAPLYGEDGIDQSGNAQSARADGQYHIGTFDCPDIDTSVNFDAITNAGNAVTTTAQTFCTVKICGTPVKTSDSGPTFPIDETIDRLKSKATVIATNPPNGSTFGTADNPGIFYCPGNLTTNNLTVYGVLLVEGNVELAGNANAITGVSLVKGTSLIKGGGNKATYGAWLGHKMVTLDGGVEFYFDCRVFQNLFNKFESYRMVCWNNPA